jgi:Tfp pilus assembly protein PilN
MQLDLRYALIGQLYEQAVLLTAKLEQLAKENAELKSAAEKPQDPA